MKRLAAALASASKRTALSAQKSAPNQSQRDTSLAKGDLSELRQQRGEIGEGLRAAEAEQAALSTKLKEAEKEAKNAKEALVEALASFQGVVVEKRSAFAEISQKVSAAVCVAGATKVPIALGQAIFHTVADQCLHAIVCEIDVVVQVKCYKVVQSGKSAKVKRYESGSKASETESDLPQAAREKPKKPLFDFVISCARICDSGHTSGTVAHDDGGW